MRCHIKMLKHVEWTGKIQYFSIKCQIIDIQSIRVSFKCLYMWFFCINACDAYRLQHVDIFMSENCCHANGSMLYHELRQRWQTHQTLMTKSVCVQNEKKKNQNRSQTNKYSGIRSEKHSTVNLIWANKMKL